MADLFGFQGGRRMALLDRANLRKIDADVRQTEQEIKAGETALAANEAFLNAVRGGDLQGKVTDAADLPGALSELGQLALATGNFDKGRELITAGSTVANQQSLMARRDAKTNFENLQTLSNLYSTVKDERGWQQANAQFELLTGHQSPYAGMQFSPMLLEQARAATVTEKDRAAAGLAQTRRDLVESQIATDEQRRELLTAQEEYTRERTANLNKVGGKPVPSQYVTAVANKLKDEFSDIGYLDSARINSMALPYAEQAWQKVRDEGYTLSQAVTEIVSDAVESGEFGGWTPMSAFRPGEHRDRPMPVPMKSGKLDTAALKPNKYYIIPGTGQVFLRTKDGKNLVIDPLEDDDEDDETADDADYDPELEE